jgi:alpha-beta hydrolase superfamily lysophospholipase
VILLGHSLGGHMAPKIADQLKIDGVIVMAGNASSMVDLVVPQLEYLMKNDSTSAINQFQLNAMKFQVKNYKEGNFDSTTVGPTLPFGLSGIYWNSYKGYDPLKLAKKQDQPYLILNGGRDYQVTTEEAKKWKDGNNHKLSKTIIYPKLNHMFFAGEGILLPAEYEIEAHLEAALF